MKRYYCPQVHDNVKGWIDLPSLASLSKKDADAFAKAFAEDHKRVTRTIRKPHGWTPDQ
jgi:hypothetical protein